MTQLGNWICWICVVAFCKKKTHELLLELLIRLIQSTRSAGSGCGYLFIVFKYMVKFPQLIFLHGKCSCCDLRVMYLNRNRIHLSAAAVRLRITLYGCQYFVYKFLIVSTKYGARGIEVVPLKHSMLNESLKKASHFMTRLIIK